MDTQTQSEHTPIHHEMERWRVGRKLGRTVYRQHCKTNAPCTECDEFLGIFDSGVEADLVCKVMNQWFSQGNTSVGTVGSAG